MEGPKDGFFNNSTVASNSSNQTFSTNDNPIVNQMFSGNIINDLQQLKIILIFNSSTVHLQNLQPLVGKGWKPILNTVWLVGITQTFAESITFAMI